MKKLIALAICLGFILSVSAAYAAPVGNIATPSLLKKGLIMKDDKSDWGIIAGSEIDITFDRKLKGQLGDTEFNFYGAKTGIIIADKVLAYALLGVGNASQEFTMFGETCQYETETDFVWGVGATVIAYEQEIQGNTLRIGLDGRYRRADLGIEKIKVSGESYSLSDNNITLDCKLDEWQAALALSYQIGNFIPYAGVKYSDVDGKMEATFDGETDKENIEAEDNVGIFVGGDIMINDSITVNAEGRFIDETALSLAGTIRF